MTTPRPLPSARLAPADSKGTGRSGAVGTGQYSAPVFRPLEFHRNRLEFYWSPCLELYWNFDGFPPYFDRLSGVAQSHPGWPPPGPFPMPPGRFQYQILRNSKDSKYSNIGIGIIAIRIPMPAWENPARLAYTEQAWGRTVTSQFFIFASFKGACLSRLCRHWRHRWSCSANYRWRPETEVTIDNLVAGVPFTHCSCPN